MILEFKNGNKIHIKKSHQGLFTKYCNGNVTDECIKRGKNSSDPKIRKRATFAANARRWKHQQGGNIVTVNDVSQNGITYNQWKNLTPEEQNYRRKNIARQYLSNPSIPNLFNAATTYLGFNDPQNPDLNTGIAPTPSRKFNPRQLEKLEDKAMGITKKQYKSHKLSQSWADNDLRHYSSGQSRMQNSKRTLAIEQAKENPATSKQIHNILLRQAKSKVKGVSTKSINQELRDFIDNYINQYGIY